jgi:hypothetical protein
MTPKTSPRRHLDDADAQAGQGEHVDQDVDAEAEERVGVAAYPIGEFKPALGGSVVSVMTLLAGGATAVDDPATQPKMPPWAAIISRPTRWNSGK